MKNRYQTPMPSSWWLHRPAFRRFMARELTCIFVLGYVIYLLVWLWQLGEGPKEYAAMIECARSPLSVTLHLVALAGVLYHAITWFQLTPQIMPLYIGEDRLPDALAAIAMGYLPWLVVTGIVLWGIMSVEAGP